MFSMRKNFETIGIIVQDLYVQISTMPLYTDSNRQSPGVLTSSMSSFDAKYSWFGVTVVWYTAIKKKNAQTIVCPGVMHFAEVTLHFVMACIA